MKTDHIRDAFLRFFEERGHRRMPGAPLVPPGDPTLLFTSAGMVQFKPYFMGQAKAPHPRLTTVQKCFRTSDIDSVGDTSHLTFFEMLGNFSVSDYFKAEAIPWAWEFVSSGDWLGLDPDRLWAAVYLDDDEAFDLWRQFLPPERIRRYGEKDNYWFSGEVGPCGPCSELHYDFGPEFGCGPDCEPDHEDCDRFLEIWNLVFMSYFCDGEKRDPLPSKNIDTGAGLERLAVASLFESDEWEDKSKLPSVYDTDLFTPVIRRLEELSGKRYGEDAATDRATRIVAEHARAVTFLIGDERTPVIPSNEERGYAARRILRRAVYFGRRYLGLEPASGGFLSDLAETAIQGMSGAYPELDSQRKFVLDILAPEELRFEETLSRGLEMLDEALARYGKEKLLPAGEAFLLHDTYGFPLELTTEIAHERGFTVDEAGFQAEMEKQRERARAARGQAQVVAPSGVPSEEEFGAAVVFVGYERLAAESEIIGLAVGGRSRKTAKDPAEVEVFLAETPFYAEAGGQVGDRGVIVGPNGIVAVDDTQRVAQRLIVHRGRVVEGRIAVGDTVTARVDPQHRQDTMRNHTGTHLLHAALRRVLGAHVRQAGSLVAPGYLRFDFTHTEAMTEEQIAEVQRLVNEKIRRDLPVDTRQTGYDQAISEGVLAFFGEKYGEDVRVVEVDPTASRFSAELCAGTHCSRTGEIGMLIITGESSIGAGMRRIEALTGGGAEEYVRGQLIMIDAMSRRLGAPREAISRKVDMIVDDLANEQRLFVEFKRKTYKALSGFLVGSQRERRAKAQDMAAGLAADLAIDQIEYVELKDIDDIRVISYRVPSWMVSNVDDMLQLADFFKLISANMVRVFGAEIAGRPIFVAIVAEDIIDRGPASGGLRADALVREIARVTGGGGGGRPDMATGGGKDPAKLADALKQVPDIARKLLSKG